MGMFRYKNISHDHFVEAVKFEEPDSPDATVCLPGWFLSLLANQQIVWQSGTSSWALIRGYNMLHLKCGWWVIRMPGNEYTVASDDYFQHHYRKE